jgi:mRNA-degrading endonuclease RelE of RelBE toxin-antitoxin system
LEIKIRNVDPTAVKKMDELAKKHKLSRQELLKGQLETLAFFREQVKREHELESLIKKKTRWEL